MLRLLIRLLTDMERANDDKTSAVHFLRFQFNADDVAAAVSGAPISFAVDHSSYNVAPFLVDESVRKALIADFNP